jgi:hypothetical protein
MLKIDKENPDQRVPLADIRGRHPEPLEGTCTNVLQRSKMLLAFDKPTEA